MKKIYSILAAAALSCAGNAYAGIYTGYSQDFTSNPNPADVGCFSTSAPDLFSISGDTKVLNFGKPGNARSAYIFWGAEVWSSANQAELAGDGENKNDNYTVTFDFSCAGGTDTKKNGDDWAQHNMHLALASETDVNASPYKKNGTFFETVSDDFLESGGTTDGGYKGNNANWLFAISEEANSTLNPEPAKRILFNIAGTDKNVTLEANVQYNFKFTINIDTRKLNYVIKEIASETVVAEGEYTVPETRGIHNVNILPTSLYTNVERSGLVSFDNIQVGKYTDKSLVKTPELVFNSVFNEMRIYAPVFGSNQTFCWRIAEEYDGAVCDYENGESLGLEGVITPDMLEEGAEGYNPFLLFSQSCVIEIWADEDGEKSASAEVNIECGLVHLPAPVVDLAGAAAGIGKTFKLSVDNSDVLGTPGCSVKYFFTYADGKKSDVTTVENGAKIDVPQACWVTAWAVANGYVESEKVSKANNQNYAQSWEIDFEHMTGEYIMSLNDTEMYSAEGHAKWAKIDNLDPANFEAGKEQSGENAWIGRYRLAALNESGDGVDVPLFIERYQLDKTANTITAEEVASIFPHMILWTHSEALNYQISVGIGLLQTTTKQNNQTITLTGMNEGEVACVETIYNYGENYAQATGAKGSATPEDINVADYYSQVDIAGKSYYFYPKSAVKPASANHGEVTSVVVADAEGNGSFTNYRVQNAISRIFILAPDGDPINLGDEPSAITDIVAEKSVDNSVYSLSGAKMNGQNLKPGVYVKAGKLIMVK